MLRREYINSSGKRASQASQAIYVKFHFKMVKKLPKYIKTFGSLLVTPVTPQKGQKRSEQVNFRPSRTHCSFPTGVKQ